MSQPVGLTGIVQTVIFPALGLTLGFLARRSLPATPRRADILWCLSLVCVCVGLTIWPPAMTTLVDSTTRVRGLAHLVSDGLITGAFVLQFAFTCAVDGRWTWARGGAFVPYVALLGTYAVQWATLHDTHSFYGTYDGRTPALLAANITLVALIAWAAALALAGYAGHLREGGHSAARTMALTVAFVSGLAILYDLLILGQVIFSALGYGSTQIVALTVPIMALAGMVGTLVVWLLTDRRARPVRAYALAVASARHRDVELDEREARLDDREARLNEREGYIADLAAFVEDQLIQVHPDVDDRAVRDMQTWCATTGLTPRRTRATLLTTRLALLIEARALKIPRYDLNLMMDGDDGTEDDPAREVAAHEDLLSDVMHLLQLVAPVPLPAGIEPRDEPPGWRRDAAAAITAALRRYGYNRRNQSA